MWEINQIIQVKLLIQSLVHKFLLNNPYPFLLLLSKMHILKRSLPLTLWICLYISSFFLFSLLWHCLYSTIFFNQKEKLYRGKRILQLGEALEKKFFLLLLEGYSAEHLPHDTCWKKEGNWMMYSWGNTTLYTSHSVILKCSLSYLKFWELGSKGTSKLYLTETLPDFSH